MRRIYGILTVDWLAAGGFLALLAVLAGVVIWLAVAP